MTEATVWLTCVECQAQVEETWDGRCCSCFYVYTGGDQGEDDWWQTHAFIRQDGIYLETQATLSPPKQESS